MNKGFFMRRSLVMAELGLEKREFALLVPVKLRPVYLRAGGRAYFIRDEVEALKLEARQQRKIVAA